MDFEPISSEELKALISPLRFNNFFRGIDLKGIKLEKEVIAAFQVLLKFNNYIEEIRLSSIIAPRELFGQVFECIIENKNIGLTVIDFSNSPVDDKGKLWSWGCSFLLALATFANGYLANEEACSTLRVLNLSNTGIGKAGIQRCDCVFTVSGLKALFSALKQNASLSITLDVLDLSNIKIDGSIVLDITSFLSTPNNILELNLSNIGIGMEPFLQAVSGVLMSR